MAVARIFTVPLFDCVELACVGATSPEAATAAVFDEAVKVGARPLAELEAWRDRAAEQLKDAGSVDGCCSRDQHPVVVWVCGDPSAGLLAHEALHAVVEICKHVGVEFDHDNHETQAYLLGWVVDRLVETLWPCGWRHTEEEK